MITALIIYLVIGILAALYYRWTETITLVGMLFVAVGWLPIWLWILAVSFWESAGDIDYD